MQVLKPSVVPAGLNKYTERGIHGMLLMLGIVQQPHTPVSIHLFSDRQSPSSLGKGLIQNLTRLLLCSSFISKQTSQAINTDSVYMSLK